MQPLIRVMFSALCLVPFANAAVSAEPALYRGEFTLSFLGFTVARANFDSHVDERTYSIQGTISSAGLAALFDDTSGTLSAVGRFSEKAPRAELFRADYQSGGKATLVDIGFTGGNVTRTTNVPPLKARGTDWVPLGPDDLKSVTDPIAATLVRAPSLDEVCGRTAKFYDGELRADLRLSYASSGKIDVRGYSGRTVTCRMNFIPVSGYRKGRRALEFLKTRSRIMVTFAPIGQTGIYAPIHATIGTEIGTITVRARRFEAIP